MSEINELLADVKQEGTPIADLVETPSDSPTEKETEKDKPAEGENTPEDNLPFHKHPRWIERENELKTLRERDEQTARELAELKSFKEETSKRFEPDSEVPEWFQKLYGDNKEAYKAYEVEHKRELAEIEQGIITRQQEAILQAEAENKKWLGWVDTGIKNLEKEIGIDLTSENDKDVNGNPVNATRNEILKLMLDYGTTDESGNYDFKKGYEIYKLMHQNDTNNSQDRKKLADTITKSSNTVRKEKDYMTLNDTRRKSWATL